MERIIKFRGKDKNGNWRYGNLIYATDRWYKKNKGGFHKEWIAERVFSNGGYINLCVRYCVKKETLGQFTGLYDKNGKEIYEGDIMQTNLNAKPFGIVSWNERGFFFIDTSFGKYPSGEYIPLGNALRIIIDKKTLQWEIIGNIYDNYDIIQRHVK